MTPNCPSALPAIPEAISIRMLTTMRRTLASKKTEGRDGRHLSASVTVSTRQLAAGRERRPESKGHCQSYEGAGNATYSEPNLLVL